LPHFVFAGERNIAWVFCQGAGLWDVDGIVIQKPMIVVEGPKAMKIVVEGPRAMKIVTEGPKTMKIVAEGPRAMKIGAEMEEGLGTMKRASFGQGQEAASRPAVVYNLPSNPL
jgi:hypothetical protein